MNRASAFGRGSWVRAQLSYSQLSLDLHDRDASSIDPDGVVREDFVRYRMETWVEGNRMYASFGHLQNYTSNYYTYLFDKVIALDFFDEFKARDPLRDPAAARYRHFVLEPGGSMPAKDLVRKFLGRPQGYAAFERWLQEEFAR
jgi:thimet oligopeptidase